MKHVSMMICVLFLHSFVKAQHSKFQVGIGYQRTWMVDKQASPLKYQSSEKTFLIGYEHAGPHAKFAVKIDGGLGSFFPTGFAGRQFYNPGYNEDGSPKSDSFTMKGKLYNARIKLGYMKALPSGYSKIGKNNIYTNDYLGGSINNQLFYSDNLVRTGWMNSSSVNADYEHAIQFNTKHNVSLKLSIPLFARNTRLLYHNTISSGNGDSGAKTFFKQGSGFASVFDFQNVQISASYEYALSKKMGIGLQYSGQWLHYNREKPVTLFQNNIGVIASVK